MQGFAHGVACLLVLAGCAVASQFREGVTPIGKVLELLANLETKLTKQGTEADKAFEEYSEWCVLGKKDIGFKVTTTKAEIDDLTATIEKAKADATTETSRIESLVAAIAEGEADLKAATTIRANESAQFTAAETELVDVVDTLDRAINVLSRKLKGSTLVQQAVDTKNVASLLRSLEAVVEAAGVPADDQKKLVALAQGGAEASSEANSDDAELGAPAPDAYKGHSMNIVEVLEDMREKAEAQLTELRKQETNALHSYQMTAQSLRDQAAADTKEMGQAKAAKAEASETLAISKGDMEVAKKTLDTSETQLSELKKGCATATADYEASKKSRAEEIGAIRQAQKIIAESTGGAESAVYGGASSLVQQRQEQVSFALSTRADLVNFEVVSFLRQLAKKEKSPSLTQLASRVAATVHFAAQVGEDPFAKVKGLIEGLIEKLEKEAGEDAKHKEWCDQEYAETGAKKDDLTSTVEKLSTKIDKASSTSITLKDEVKETQGALAELLRAQSEADKVRQEQNALYTETKADLEQGLVGVRQAVKVLRDYYSGEDAAHGKSEAGGSIIGLLEVVESDLSKSLAEAETEEDTAASEYQKTTMENKLTRATYESDIEYKTKETVNLDKAVAELSSDRESSQSELEALLEYTKGVRASCEVKPETYADRKARREAELAGLKEAMEILSSELSFAQRTLRGFHHA